MMIATHIDVIGKSVIHEIKVIEKSVSQSFQRIRNSQVQYLEGTYSNSNQRCSRNFILSGFRLATVTYMYITA